MSCWVYLAIAIVNVPLASYYGPELYSIVSGAMMVTWFVLGVEP